MHVETFQIEVVHLYIAKCIGLLYSAPFVGIRDEDGFELHVN